MTKPGEEPMRLRSLAVPDGLWDEAGQIAEAQGISRSELARRGLMREIRWQRLKLTRAAILAAKKNGGAK